MTAVSQPLTLQFLYSLKSYWDKLASSRKGRTTLFALGFVTLYSLRNVYCRLHRKLNHLPPGPDGIPVFGSLFSATNISQFGFYLSANYGPITMVYIGWQNFVFLHSIDTIKAAFMNENALCRDWDKALMLQHLNPSDLGLSLTPYKYWHNKRKIFQSIMISKLDSTFLNDVHNKSLQTHVLKSMNKCIETNKLWFPLDDVAYIQFHFIWNAVYGSYLPFDNTEQDTIVHYVSKITDETVPDILLRYMHLDKFIPKRFIASMFSYDKLLHDYLESRLYKRLNYDELVFDINDHKWDKHFEEIRNDNNACVASKLIAHHRLKPVPDINSLKDHIIQSLIVMFFAGIETSTHTTEFGLILLAKNVEKQHMIYQELFNVFGNDIPMHKIKLKKGIHQLHYLRAFIHELLRLSTVAPIGLAHYNRDKDIVINGYNIPKRSIIIGDLKTANLCDEYWKKKTNDKTNELCLDAWLDDNGHFKVNMNKDKMMSFGVGPRVCAGKALVLRSLYLVFAKLILCYKFEVDQDVEIKQEFQFMMRVKPKIGLKLTKR